MIYQVTCGNCLLDFKIDNTHPSCEWTCTNCGEVQTTSVPVDNTGKLIEVVGFGSIIGEKKEDVPVDPKEIIDSKPLTGSKEDVVKSDNVIKPEDIVEPIP